LRRELFRGRSVRIEAVFFMSDQKIALIFAVANSTRKIGGFIVQRRRLIVQSIVAGCIVVKEITKSRASW
jgi:hypothetical protein